MSTFVRCLVLFIPLVLAPLPARADAIDSRVQAAAMACSSGDYGNGVEILTRLFVETKDRSYLFRQGVCLEQSGRYHDAFLRYREYLRRRGSGAAGTMDVEAERRLAHCQALAVASGSASAGPLFDVGRPTGVVEPPGKKQSSSLDDRNGGIVMMATGTVFLSVGLLFHLRTNAVERELGSVADQAQRDEKERERTQDKVLGWTCYGLGGTMLVLGTVFYSIGLARNDDAKLVLRPSLAPGTAGAILQGRF
jgi:hypothetical protein